MAAGCLKIKVTQANGGESGGVVISWSVNCIRRNAARRIQKNEISFLCFFFNLSSVWFFLIFELISMFTFPFLDHFSSLGAMNDRSIYRCSSCDWFVDAFRPGAGDQYGCTNDHLLCSRCTKSEARQSSCKVKKIQNSMMVTVSRCAAMGFLMSHHFIRKVPSDLARFTFVRGSKGVHTARRVDYM